MTQKEYNRQRNEFINKHKNKDKYYTIQTITNPDIFTSKLQSFAVEKDGWNGSKYLNKWYYILATVLLCLPFYRIWMTSIIGGDKYKYYQYTFIKELNISVPTDLLINGIFRTTFDDQYILPTAIATMVEEHIGTLNYTK